MQVLTAAVRHTPVVEIWVLGNLPVSQDLFIFSVATSATLWLLSKTVPRRRRANLVGILYRICGRWTRRFLLKCHFSNGYVGEYGFNF